MKKILLMLIVFAQISLIASSVVEEKTPDPLAGKVVRIDASTFLAQQNFGITPPPVPGMVQCVGIRNSAGVLEAFNSALSHERLGEIYGRNTPSEPLTANISTTDWVRMVTETSSDGTTVYSGQNRETSGDAIRIDSTQGFDFCNAIFIGNTPLVLQTKGQQRSPFFAMVIEAFEPGECPRSIFEEKGGAMISGTLDFSSPLGADYLRGNFLLTIDDSAPIQCFMVAARSVTLIMKGQRQV